MARLIESATVIAAAGNLPKHIKEYKLSRRFGERVGVERIALLEGMNENEALGNPLTHAIEQEEDGDQICDSNGVYYRGHSHVPSSFLE